MSLWRVEEAADYLGIRPKTLYEWVRSGRVPHRKIGFNVRFEPGELEAWAASQAQGPQRRKRSKARKASVEDGDVPVSWGAAELGKLASEAARALRDLERDVGTHLSYPQRKSLGELVDRLDKAARTSMGKG